MLGSWRRATVACALWGIGVAAWADPGSGYRVSGILAVGQDYLALLAGPDGHQTLVRAGSAIDGGRVLEVTAHGLRLSVHGTEVALALDGAAGVAPAPARVAAAPAAPRPIVPASARPLPVRLSDGPAYRSQVVSPARVRALAVSGAGGLDAEPARALAVGLESVASVPPNARITQVNDLPVTDVDAALARVAARLDAGFPAWLSVESPAGSQRLYFTAPRH